MAKKIVKTFLLLLFFQSIAFAGQSAGVFLEIPASVRAGGMADCFSATADEPLGIYYNPAGAGFIKKTTLSFVYQKYLEDITGNYIAITVPYKNLSITAAPSVVSMKEEPVYDSSGNDTGRKFKYQGTIIPFSAAFRIRDLSIGATAKSYKEEIGTYSKSVTTFDAGLIYKLKNLDLGVSGLNLSGRLGNYELPKTIKYGLAYTAKKATLLFDYNSQLAVKSNTYNAGGEFLISDFMFLRVGYKIKDEFGGLSYGFSVRMREFDIDYAASHYGELGLTQRAGINYTFGRVKTVKPDKPKPIEDLKTR